MTRSRRSHFKAYLASIDGVAEVDDLHIWGLSTADTALIAHLAFPGGYPGDAKQVAISEQLRKRFNIGHSTIQVELGQPGHACGLASPDTGTA